MFEQYTTNNQGFNQFKQEFKQRNILSKLIIINVGVFLLILVFRVLFFLAGYSINPLLSLLSVPSSIDNLIYNRPWSIFTYMFVHYSFWHVVFNMLWLYWMGKIFLKYFGKKYILSIYIIGGLGGALLYILCFNTLPGLARYNADSYAVGASASVMAVFLAVAVYRPNYSLLLIFIGRIKIIHLALVYILMDLLMMPNGNTGGHIAHIGGALMGVIFGLYMKREAPIKSNSNNTKNQSYTRKKNYTQNVQSKSEEDQINIILDKVAKSGYESLTKEERKKLFKSSSKK